MNSQSTFLILTSFVVMLSKGCKPDKFKSCDSLKLRFTNIQGFIIQYSQGNSDNVVLISIDFLSSSKEDTPFHL